MSGQSETVRHSFEAYRIGSVMVTMHTMRRAGTQPTCAVTFGTGPTSLSAGLHGRTDEWRAFAIALIEHCDEVEKKPNVVEASS